MKLFTITATPVRNEEQWAKHLKDTGEEVVLNKRKVEELNTVTLEVYPQIVARILSQHGFDGFTMYQVNGYWQGVPEVSFKIEIAVDSDPERVYTVAKVLRDLYNQDAVMLTLPNNSVKFI